MAHVEPRLDASIQQLEQWAGSKLPISKVNDGRMAFASGCGGTG